MTKILLGLALFLAVLPVTAYASWWNPFTWNWNKASYIENKTATTSEPMTATLTVQDEVEESFSPSVDELLKRVAELEDKLAKALEANKTLKSEPKVETKVVAKTAEPVSQLGDTQIQSKVKPALVLVETATTSASGVVIDTQGHIMTSAKVILVETQGKVSGVVSEVSITLGTGVKKKARVIGFDEARDVALLKIIDKGTYSYIPTAYDSGLQSGGTVYVASSQYSKGSIGENFISGPITSKTGTLVEMTSNKKPRDDNGPMVNGKGEFVGLANPSSCKVIEEMQKCLTYKVSARVFRDVTAKLYDGMKLFVSKPSQTKFEELVKGQLEGVYANTKEGVLINHAITNVTGKNSFDYLNNKLADDENYQISKIYLNKLKLSAERFYKAYDFYKTQAYDLNIFFINEESSIAGLDSYQRKILEKIRVDNLAKMKEYDAKLSAWTKKKNEFDSYISKLEDSTHDYLMAQGVFIESEVKYLEAEQKRIINLFSGETLAIF